VTGWDTGIFTLDYSESGVEHAEGRELSELSKELDLTIRLLEAEIPANPASHENLERKLAKGMRDYFRNLSDALPWNDLEALYYKNARPE